MDRDWVGRCSDRKRGRVMVKITWETERRESWGREGSLLGTSRGLGLGLDDEGVCLGRQCARQKCWGTERPPASEMLHGSLTPPISRE